MIRKTHPKPGPAPDITRPERLLALAEVEAQTGLKKTSLYGLVRKGEFPPPVRLSRRCSRWPASQVQAWIADRIHGSLSQ